MPEATRVADERAYSRISVTVQRALSAAANVVVRKSPGAFQGKDVQPNDRLDMTLVEAPGDRRHEPGPPDLCRGPCRLQIVPLTRRLVAAERGGDRAVIAEGFAREGLFLKADQVRGGATIQDNEVDEVAEPRIAARPRLT